MAVELIFNELSLHPVADSPHSAELLFTTLLKTFRAAKEKYDCSHIRFPIHYSSAKITESLTFVEWVPTIKNSILKNLILDLIKLPFVDDLEDHELHEYVHCSFEISDKSCPTKNSPLGLPIAYIKSLPSVSLSSHEFWKSTKISVIKRMESNSEDVLFETYNLCEENDVLSSNLIEWEDDFWSLSLETIEDLDKFLGFQKLDSNFSQAFLSQLDEWKQNDSVTYKYILRLMKDIEIHPFSGGMGQTENLKKRGKEGSKRINYGDRLSYRVENNKVFFLACKMHYDFH